MQENDNVEMMAHLEGPIVDSFYEVCLNSWHNQLKPSLPMLNIPARSRPYPSFGAQRQNNKSDENERLRNLTGSTDAPIGMADTPYPVETANRQPRFEQTSDTTRTEAAGIPSLVQQGDYNPLPAHTSEDPHYDPDIASEVLRAQSVLSPRNGESRMKAITRHLSMFVDVQLQP